MDSVNRMKPTTSGNGNGSSNGNGHNGNGRTAERDPGELIDLEAEKATVGACLIQPERIDEVDAILRASTDFVAADETGEPRLRWVHEAILRLHRDEKAVDPVTVRDASIENGHPVDAMFLIELMDKVPDPVNAAHYAEIVRKKALLRELVREGGEIRSDALRHDADPTAIFARMREIADDQSGNDSSFQLDWKSPHELEDAPDVEFVWSGYLSPRHITVVSAAPKDGKTTLVAGVLAEAGQAQGGYVAGAVKPFKALIVTEESGSIWKRRCQEFGIIDNVQIASRPFPTGKAASREEWRNLVEACGLKAEEDGFDCIVFDTLAGLWNVQNENDAGEVTTAVGPLQALADTGVAVLAIHHNRKTLGSNGSAMRGSSALLAAVEISIDFRRFDDDDPEDRRRTMRTKSRFPETPTSMVIELDEDGTTIRDLGPESEVKGQDPGDREAAKAEKVIEREGKILKFLLTRPDGAIKREIQAKGLNGTIVKERVDDMVKRGILEPVKDGKRERFRLTEDGREYAEGSYVSPF